MTGALRWAADRARLLCRSMILLAMPAIVGAQNWQTVLTLNGWPLTVTTSVTDFQAGSVALGSTTISVDATTNNNDRFPVRVTTIRVQCVAACPRSGTSTATGLQWRRDDQAAWSDLTTTYVDVETRTVTFNGTNDPWSRIMFWRYLVTWTGNPPATATEYRIMFQMVVAAP